MHCYAKLNNCAWEMNMGEGSQSLQFKLFKRLKEIQNSWGNCNPILFLLFFFLSFSICILETAAIIAECFLKVRVFCTHSWLSLSTKLMETSGTDMLNDSDNRAPISPLHLAVSISFFNDDSSSNCKQLLT